MRTASAEGAVGNDAVGEVGDLQERVRIAERRLTEVDQELAAVDRELVTEHEVAESLGGFEAVWESLAPREQAGVIQMLDGSSSVWKLTATTVVCR